MGKRVKSNNRKEEGQLRFATISAEVWCSFHTPFPTDYASIALSRVHTRWVPSKLIVYLLHSGETPFLLPCC